MVDLDGCIMLDETATTSPKHGCVPTDRDIAGRLAAGWLLVDKPAGPTSHQVSAWARDLLGLSKLGHGGTLDPFATGVLALMSGRTMRLTDRVLKSGKTYVVVVRLSPDVDDAGLELELLLGRHRGPDHTDGRQCVLARRRRFTAIIYYI